MIATPSGMGDEECMLITVARIVSACCMSIYDCEAVSCMHACICVCACKLAILACSSMVNTMLIGSEAISLAHVALYSDSDWLVLASYQ